MAGGFELVIFRSIAVVPFVHLGCVLRLAGHRAQLDASKAGLKPQLQSEVVAAFIGQIRPQLFSIPLTKNGSVQPPSLGQKLGILQVLRVIPREL